LPGSHDVDDDIAEIDQNPLAIFLALDGQDFAAQRLNLVMDATTECLHLTCRLTSGDHDAIEHRGEMLDIEYVDVARLHILQRVDDGALQLQ